jgi:hypothetical protein
MRYPRTLALRTADGAPWLDVAYPRPVDDSPFYLRFLPCVRVPDVPAAALPSGGVGVGEIVRPAAVDLPQHRWLIRMAVQSLAGRNSMWLPLFAGPQRTRLRRLLRHWLRPVPSLP